MAASVREVQNLQTTVVALQGNPVAPNPPVVGDLLVWDGSAWTPQPPAAPMGVTDGSQAASGEVGEILILTGTISAAPDTGTLVTGTIPPGDWDISIMVVCNVTFLPAP